MCHITPVPLVETKLLPRRRSRRGDVGLGSAISRWSWLSPWPDLYVVRARGTRPTLFGARGHNGRRRTLLPNGNRVFIPHLDSPTFMLQLVAVALPSLYFDVRPTLDPSRCALAITHPSHSLRSPLRRKHPTVDSNGPRSMCPGLLAALPLAGKEWSVVLVSVAGTFQSRPPCALVCLVCTIASDRRRVCTARRPRSYARTSREDVLPRSASGTHPVASIRPCLGGAFALFRSQLQAWSTTLCCCQIDVIRRAVNGPRQTCRRCHTSGGYQ